MPGLRIGLYALYLIDSQIGEEIIAGWAKRIDMEKVLVSVEVVSHLAGASIEEISDKLEREGIGVVYCSGDEEVFYDCYCVPGTALPAFGLGAEDVLKFYVFEARACMEIPEDLPLIGVPFEAKTLSIVQAEWMVAGLTAPFLISRETRLLHSSPHEIRWLGGELGHHLDRLGPSITFDRLREFSPGLASRSLELIAASLDVRRLLVEDKVLSAMADHDPQCKALLPLARHDVWRSYSNGLTAELDWTAHRVAWFEEVIAAYQRFAASLLEWALEERGPYLSIDRNVPIRQRPADDDEPDRLFLFYMHLRDVSITDAAMTQMPY